MAQCQDILKGSEDLRALRNECSDLATQLIDIKKQHAEEIKAHEDSVSTEITRLNDQLKELQKSFSEAETKHKEQRQEDAERLQSTQLVLDAQKDEIKALYDDILGKSLLPSYGLMLSCTSSTYD